MTQLSPPISSSRINVADAPMLGAVLLFDSLHYIWAVMLIPYVDPAISAPLVMGIAVIQIGIYAIAKGQLSLAPLRKHFWFFVTIGILIGFSTYVGYLAVKFVDAGTASMLNKSGVVFSLALGFVWLRERFTPIQLLGALISIVGTFVIAYQASATLQWGMLLVLVSTLSYVSHFAVVKRYGGEMDFVNFLFYRMLLTTITLLLMSGVRGALGWPSPMAWFLIFITATFDVTVSRAFYYFALRKLDMSLLSVITTLGPVLTILWALLFFGTFPTWRQLVGGTLVLCGVLIVTIYARKE